MLTSTDHFPPDPAFGRTRNRFIDICRGVAILGVLFHHYFFGVIVQNIDFNAARAWQIALASLNNGWLGVNLFFVLSGCVLYRTDLFASRTSILTFYIRRARRLWPLFFVFIAVLALVEQRSVWLFVKSTFLLLSGANNLIPSEWMPGQLRHALWSLGPEILFSLLLPFLIMATKQAGFWRVFWFVLIFCVVYRAIADVAWFRIDPDYVNRQLNPLKDNIVGRLDDFVVGMGIARFSIEQRRLPAYTVAAAGAAIAFVLLAWTFIWFWPRTVMISVLASVLNPLLSLSVFAIVSVLGHRRIWSAAIWSPLVFAGLTCYSAYLTHTTIIRAFWQYAGTWLYAPMFLLFAAATFAIASVLFIFFEAAAIRRLPDWAMRASGATSGERFAGCR